MSTKSPCGAGTPRHLFVYGTLRRRSRHPMARFLAERARFVCETRIAGRLHDLGRYPGMQPPTQPDDWVQGDLYDLGDGTTTLAELDAYENSEAPTHTEYRRESATVLNHEGKAVATWVYWYGGEVDESMRIASGCWTKNCEP